MLSHTEYELYQLSFLDVTYEEDRKANQEFVRELVEGKRQHFETEKRCRRKEDLVWVRNNGALVPGQDDAAPFWLAVVEDITQREEKESARRYSEDMYRASDRRPGIETGYMGPVRGRAVRVQAGCKS